MKNFRVEDINFDINDFRKPGKEYQKDLIFNAKISENFKDMPTLNATFLERRKNRDLSLTSSSSLTTEEILIAQDSQKILAKTLKSISPNRKNVNEIRINDRSLPSHVFPTDLNELDQRELTTHGNRSFNFESFISSATSNKSKYDWRSYLRGIRDQVREIETTVEKNETTHNDELHSKEMRMVDGQYIAEKDISHHAVEYDIALNRLNSDMAKLASKRENAQAMLDAARSKNILHYKNHNVKLPCSEEFINQKFEMKKKIYKLIEKERKLASSSDYKVIDQSPDFSNKNKMGKTKIEIEKENDLIYDGSDSDLERMWLKALSKHNKSSKKELKIANSEEPFPSSLKDSPIDESMLEDYVSKYIHVKEPLSSSEEDRNTSANVALNEYHEEIERILKSRDRKSDTHKANNYLHSYKDRKPNASKVESKSQRSKSIINNFKRKSQMHRSASSSSNNETEIETERKNKNNDDEEYDEGNETLTSDYNLAAKFPNSMSSTGDVHSLVYLDEEKMKQKKKILQESEEKVKELKHSLPLPPIQKRESIFLSGWLMMNIDNDWKPRWFKLIWNDPPLMLGYATETPSTIYKDESCPSKIDKNNIGMSAGDIDREAPLITIQLHKKIKVYTLSDRKEGQKQGSFDSGSNTSGKRNIKNNNATLSNSSVESILTNNPTGKIYQDKNTFFIENLSTSNSDNSHDYMFQCVNESDCTRWTYELQKTIVCYQKMISVGDQVEKPVGTVFATQPQEYENDDIKKECGQSENENSRKSVSSKQRQANQLSSTSTSTDTSFNVIKNSVIPLTTTLRSLPHLLSSSDIMKQGILLLHESNKIKQWINVQVRLYNTHGHHRCPLIVVVQEEPPFAVTNFIPLHETKVDWIKDTIAGVGNMKPFFAVKLVASDDEEEDFSANMSTNLILHHNSTRVVNDWAETITLLIERHRRTTQTYSKNDWKELRLYLSRCRTMLLKPK